MGDSSASTSSSQTTSTTTQNISTTNYNVGRDMGLTGQNAVDALALITSLSYASQASIERQQAAALTTAQSSASLASEAIHAAQASNPTVEIVLVGGIILALILMMGR